MPLSIWLVSQSYLPYHGGITEHVWHLAGALAARGHDVSILTGHAGTVPCAPNRHPPGVRILRTGRTLRLPSHGSRACVTITWPRRRRILAQAPPPDVVHLQSPLEPLLPLWAIKHLPGLKIGTFHTGGAAPHWGYRWGAPYLARYARRLDRRIAVSREAVRFVRAHLPGRYDVIPNGVDVGRFVPTPGTGPSDPSTLRALYVGRLDPRKGLFTLLGGLARYQHRRITAALPALELDIVGGGPLADPLRAMARRERLPVRFRGVVARDRLPGYYRSSDLCVALSEHGESFGINILEAMASGRPVVAANIDGYRETVSGSGGALLVEAGSAQACGRALAKLAGNPTLRQEMGRAARSHALRFAWPIVAARVESVYRDALAGAHVRRGAEGRSAEQSAVVHAE